MRKKIEEIYKTLIQKLEQKGNPGGLLNLREKGVECAIILPLLEYLGFNPLLDIQYEVSSTTMNGQRFDFVIGDSKFQEDDPRKKYNIVLEIKSLDTKIAIGSDGNKQIQNYILSNKDIYFGILTNGIDFTFFLDKQCILDVLEKKDFTTPGYGNILPIFSINIQDIIEERTIPILEMFTKDHYIENIKKLASLTYKTITDEGYKREVLVQDKSINEYIREKIKESLIGQRGDLFDSIVTGKIKENDLIKYKNPLFSIAFKIDKFGKILLEENGIIIDKYNDLIKEEYGKKITEIAAATITKGARISYFGIDDFLQQVFDKNTKVSDSKIFAKELRTSFNKHAGK